MKVTYFEDHTIVATINRKVVEARAKGKVIKVIDLQHWELEALRQETGLGPDAVPLAVVGVHLSYEGGLTPEEYRTYQTNLGTWDEAGKYIDRWLKDSGIPPAK